MNISKLLMTVMLVIMLAGCGSPAKKDVKAAISFDQQMDVFEQLGYKLQNGVTRNTILNCVKNNYAKGTNIEAEFFKSQFELLYYYLGWGSAYPLLYYTDHCIWYDVEFIDSCDKYVSFMQRMGIITHGDLKFTDILLRIDSNNYEWIDFKVNGVYKSWRLERLGYTADSFFRRFASLPAEFSTNGQYTYYDNGSHQFVIDYATDSEQQNFINATGIQREWLEKCNKFSEPINE